MSCDTLPADGRDLAAARANAYLALAEALSSPADWSPAHPESLRDALFPTGGKLERPAGELVTAAEEAMGRREEVAVAHAQLFLGPFEVKAAPWASLYLDRDQRLMGEASQYATQAYAEAGLGPGSSQQDAPDHIAHELEFMYFLAFQEATTGETGWRERQQRFWNEHLGRWLPKLALAIRRGAVDPYYTALAELLLAFADAESADLDLDLLPVG